jgi:hypothetical protein
MRTTEGFEGAALQMEGETWMIEAIFPKRAPSPRERDTRPVPSDYRPKQLRAVGNGDADGFYADEPPGALDGAAINLHKLEDDLLNRNRLDEIAALVRALTYGEMMDLAHAIWNIRPEGMIDQNSLPMMLHLWSTSGAGGEAEVRITDGKAADSKAADSKAADARAAP